MGQFMYSVLFTVRAGVQSRRSLLVLVLYTAAGHLRVSRRVCLGCGEGSDGSEAPPGADAICFTGQLRSQHYRGHDQTGGPMEAHLLNQWPILASQFPSADVFMVTWNRDCDAVVATARRFHSQGRKRRMLVWCHDDAVTFEERNFIDNAPVVAQPRIKVVAQWREVAACAAMAEALPGPAYRRITKSRYDGKICALRVEDLPLDAIALSPSSILDATGEFLIQDFMLTGPGKLMRKLLRFYEWFIDPHSWPWWGSTLTGMTPRRQNQLTGQFPRAGPDSETMLKYYLFLEGIPVRRVHASALLVGKGRNGVNACPTWPALDTMGWPLWGEVEPKECRGCWSFDGVLTAAFAELLPRGRQSRALTTLLDLGGGIGAYARRLVSADVAAVSVDMIHPASTVFAKHWAFSWQADIRKPLSPQGRARRLARFWNRADPIKARFTVADIINGSILKELRFDWALAMDIDHLQPEAIAENVRRNAYAAIAAGRSEWLDSFEKALNFPREFGVEHKLRMFAGTTSCCTSHRTLRVYSVRPLNSNMNDSAILQRLPILDPWWTVMKPMLKSAESLALWLHAVRQRMLGATAEQRHLLVRWLGEVDWAALREASHSVFDVPLDGETQPACESFCQDGMPSAEVAQRLQAQARAGGEPCLLGCLRGLRRSREHLTQPLRFLKDGTLEFRRDGSGLYAYNAVGAMID